MRSRQRAWGRISSQIPLQGAPHASLLAAAKEHYFAFRMRDARQEATAALASLQAQPLNAESGPQLLDAALTLAQIARSQGDLKEMQRAISVALRVDPLLELSPEQYPPGIVEACATQRRELQSGPAGGLLVESAPPAAEVLLNGISRGATPMELRGLPAGDYALSAAREPLSRRGAPGEGGRGEP